jgi:peptidoglycan/xylan/chitin deacetylase (PgdA/CDA1 family)
MRYRRLVKAAVKALAFRAAEATGLTKAIGGSRWRSRRVLVLCYHGVATRDEHEWNPELYVTPAHLRQRYRLLQDMGATVLMLDRALELARSGALPPRAVAITFDDGASNFASHAVPILREFGFPATVYVTTYYVTHQLPVWNIAARYIEWATRHAPAPDASAIRNLVDADAGRPPGRAALLDAFLRQWQGRGSMDQDGAIHELASALGFDDRVMRESRMWHLMSPAEVAGLPRDLVSVQLHTHRHRQPEDWSGFAGEIEENREALEGLVGYRPVHFCYPSGIVRPGFPGYLARLGVESATTCAPGLLGPHTDAHLAPRLIDTMLTPETTFRAWVAGTGALISRT